ncbi:ribosomal protein S10 [Hydrogenobaculum sp. Y04AAS1]|jgi:small subunit ribosomal protein S10|uniref:Small ribosomal subunit protein uS10 n=1 Tax=Hydrogenobaculum sp. (strain Y04AAS1) TaxID=380749 RepID=RS10_HYDS0|nr:MULTISPECIES: 30S ribosomal protein S10 [unclassified Hydrogenobaculum]B4U743.1 RecName: Full=Small ribosomal subunit protein uS10; AltName: Full=30S ribosomal protein S10 [Hydrogenobaculum sp. Y04AAS1]HCT66646.1 30S ribosomal protein S10 [Hydrogenobaculum sp.]ACG56954.1 ribosomal protein S10 [Hydrogenobaculum sp. Y04AAS1]AEF18668.1 30S ribosomal protein S10 [Hydrogenobaculum sp. 3684]AEG45956.1 ribosomal protein S10 [Hydrogenobaculum sp. SHO]AGG14599.1 ribosomal protein S10 [Hydrogenobacu
MEQDKIRIKLKSYDYKLLDQSVKQIVETVKRTGSSVKGPIPLPTSRRRWVVLRSPHKFDQSREHFEIREFKRMLDIVKITPQTIESLMEISLPAGVDIEVKMRG